MRAVWFERFGAEPRVREVPPPGCPPHGAVIEVEATGLCRSDWHGWMGHDPGIALPHVPGHEFAGVIVEAGAEVTRCAVGDRVTVPFVCACGRCPQCRAGDHQVCAAQSQPGFTTWGSFAERVAVAHADINVVRLPADLDFVTAASLGCRFATSFRALTVHGRVRGGDWVAVHGCGGVGLSAIMIAVAYGARVIAVDTSPAALRLASDLGAEAVIAAAGTEAAGPEVAGPDGAGPDGAGPEVAVGTDMVGPDPAVAGTGGSDVAAAIRDRTAGGAHISIDALGSTTTCQNSIGCLRPRGRHVQVGLMVGGAARPEIPMGPVIAGELEIYGSHGMAAHQYPAMLADVVSGRLRPDRLVSRVISLDGAPRALVAMGDAPSPGITVVRPTRR